MLSFVLSGSGQLTQARGLALGLATTVVHHSCTTFVEVLVLTREAAGHARLHLGSVLMGLELSGQAGEAAGTVATLPVTSEVTTGAHAPLEQVELAVALRT